MRSNIIFPFTKTVSFDGSLRKGSLIVSESERRYRREAKARKGDEKGQRYWKRERAREGRKRGCLEADAQIDALVWGPSKRRLEFILCWKDCIYTYTRGPSRLLSRFSAYPACRKSRDNSARETISSGLHFNLQKKHRKKLFT